MSDQAVVRAYDYVLHRFREGVGLSEVRGEAEVGRCGIVVPRLTFFVLEEPVPDIIQPPFETGQL